MKSLNVTENKLGQMVYQGCKEKTQDIIDCSLKFRQKTDLATILKNYKEERSEERKLWK
jgi:hypothetical protein